MVAMAQRGREVITYEVRELVRSSTRHTFEVVATFPDWAERPAMMTYSEKVREHPETYFEVVKVEHVETCVAFTVQP